MEEIWGKQDQPKKNLKEWIYSRIVDNGGNKLEIWNETEGLKEGSWKKPHFLYISW